MIQALRQNPDIIFAGDSGALMLATNHAQSIASILRRMSSLAAVTTGGNTVPWQKQLAGCLVGVVRQALVPSRDGSSYYMVADTLLNEGRATKFIEEGNWAGIDEMLRARTNDRNAECVSMNAQLLELISQQKVDRKIALQKTSNYADLNQRLGGN